MIYKLHKWDSKIYNFVNSPYLLATSFRNFTLGHVINITTRLNPKKAPKHDLIIAEIITELSSKMIRLLVVIDNSGMTLDYFRNEWKVAAIILLV